MGVWVGVNLSLGSDLEECLLETKRAETTERTVTLFACANVWGVWNRCFKQTSRENTPEFGVAGLQSTLPHVSRLYTHSARGGAAAALRGPAEEPDGARGRPRRAQRRGERRPAAHDGVAEGRAHDPQQRQDLQGQCFCFLNCQGDCLGLR